MGDFLNLKEATEKWVNSFNCISQSLIRRAMESDGCCGGFTEVTTPVVGEYVGVHNYKDGFGSYELISVDYDEEVAVIFDDGEDKKIEVDYNDIYIEREEFPMWGWMWTFKNGSDEQWARENLNIVSECGFKIYEDEEDGTLYLGINGCGYDFYQAHWIPLYEERGLNWHN